MFGQDMTNGAFAVIKGNPTFELVSKGKPVVSGQFLVGRTYEIGKEAYYVGTNDDVTLYFANGLVGKINKGAEFSISSFLQEIPNINNEPSKMQFGSHLLSATLMNGDAYFSFGGGNELSSCVISTPLVDVELQKGKFYFRVEEGGVMVFVLEGKAVAHGERGKKEECESGRVIVAAPIRFKMKGVDDKIFLNTKKSKAEEARNLLAEASTLDKDITNFTFCVVNGKVVAINIR